ncbi:TolC family protein, partial [Kaarinaea lacus]
MLFFISINPVTLAEEGQAGANDPRPKLPDPLTLEYLLKLDVKDHPALQRASAAIELQNANKEFAVADYGFRANLLLEARAIEPNRIAYDQDQNDSQAHLYLNKRLYDFGKTSAAEDAAVAEIEGSELLYVNAYNQHRIAILSRFFAVLLADLTYDRDNEAMSIGYVRFDRGRHRNNLGQLSDVELLKLENQFQLLRRAYYKSQAERRNSRSRLANVVNRPGELVTDLVVPELQVPLGDIPEVEELQKNAMANNPVIKALRL